MEIQEILQKYSQDIIPEINRTIKTIRPKNLQEASAHLIKAGGKMIRPSLVLLSAEAVGGETRVAYKTAAAVELIHTFSLIHDDIMDKDEMRRGKPAVHTIWGESMAILAGDTLFSKAFELVGNTPETTSALKVNKSMQTVVDSCIQICQGQAYDMSFEGNFLVTEAEYLEMIFMKTAALIAAATKAGAILGGGSQKQVEAFHEYGKLIGMAFQIQDDYLDVASEEEHLGKPVGSDIAEGKMTLMVVHTLAMANDKDRKLLISLLQERKEKNIPLVIELFEKYGAINYTRDLAQSYVRKAKDLLNVVDDSPARQALIMMADYVLERSY